MPMPHWKLLMHSQPTLYPKQNIMMHFTTQAYYSSDKQLTFCRGKIVSVTIYRRYTVTELYRGRAENRLSGQKSWDIGLWKAVMIYWGNLSWIFMKGYILKYVYISFSVESCQDATTNKLSRLVRDGKLQIFRRRCKCNICDHASIDINSIVCSLVCQSCLF